ncbi:MAG: ImmA/IrrE family metallo-endopeptidase, partial [Bacteroidota bacterium]
FEELEEAVDRFCQEHQLPAHRPLPINQLQTLLEENYNYKIVEDGLKPYPELKSLRSVFVPQDKKLLLNGSLKDYQKTFEFGKELAFNYLMLKERAYTSSIIKGRVFEEVLNHSKAIYFSVALHMPKVSIIADMQQFFNQEKWNPAKLIEIMQKYQASPEMFYHRLTNILPQFFGMKKLFFLRFVHDLKKDDFTIDRELHLNERHHPHSNGLFEHYCRRWVSIKLLKKL